MLKTDQTDVVVAQPSPSSIQKRGGRASVLARPWPKRQSRWGYQQLSPHSESVMNMPLKHSVQLGQLQETMHPILRDPKAIEMVKALLSRHPDGTVHWFDLDLPDVVELRREFFQYCGRREVLAASILESNWIGAVRRSPGPYCFAAETV